MNADQTTILVIVAAAVGLFLWGRWRHDVVAVLALLAAVLAGLVPAASAFVGFGHPAVVTVACVLVLSRALQESGAVDALAQRALPAATGPTATIAGLALLGGTLSAFMNNVGALALLMPVALQLAAKHELPPGRLLMPLAFGSILGGMTTLIGTPPNLIVAGFRPETGAPAFTMFDYTPVGVLVAIAGIAFVSLVGWRLVPARTGAATSGFDLAAYVTEARVPDKAKAAGMSVAEVEAVLEDEQAQLVGLIRNELRLRVPTRQTRVRAGDVLVIEAESDALTNVLAQLGLELGEAVANEDDGAAKSDGDVALVELAVLPGSRLVGRSAAQLGIRSRFGVNLLAVSRQGHRSVSRLRAMQLRAGDVLLMQGPPEVVGEFASHYACVPLAERSLRLPDPRRALLAVGIMASAIAVTALGLLPAAIAFAAGVAGAALTGLIAVRRLYDSIDWPVVVLLAALLPVADALATTGTADLLARLLLDHVARGEAVVALVLILVVTMTLSDLVNNAATAAVMCPIAIGTAGSLGVAADPFLMAVAVGASCAFLTPIGHQNNTLILGPGGFRFSDYWRLGLPIELIVVGVGVPAILWFWPLS